MDFIKFDGNKENFQPSQEKHDFFIEEIGLLFNIEELESGFYGYKAFKILFGLLDPNMIKGCQLFDGDISFNNMYRYCIAFKSLEAAQIKYIEQIALSTDIKGLLPKERKIIKGLNLSQDNYLLSTGYIDYNGFFLTTNNSIVGADWGEGTKWKILTGRMNL